MSFSRNLFTYEVRKKVLMTGGEQDIHILVNHALCKLPNRSLLEGQWGWGRKRYFLKMYAKDVESFNISFGKFCSVV